MAEQLVSSLNAGSSDDPVVSNDIVENCDLSQKTSEKDILETLLIFKKQIESLGAKVDSIINNNKTKVNLNTTSHSTSHENIDNETRSPREGGQILFQFSPHEVDTGFCYGANKQGCSSCMDYCGPLNENEQVVRPKCKLYSEAVATDQHGISAVVPGTQTTQIVDTKHGSMTCELFREYNTRLPVTDLHYHPCNTQLLLTVNADGIVTVYNLVSKNAVHHVTEENNEINTFDFCLDGSVFATAGKDRNIRLYDSKTIQLIQMFEAPDFLSGNDLTVTSGHCQRIFALKFHPVEHHVFLTGGWDNSIKIWDKRVARAARTVINGPHICGPAIDIRDNKILTGSWVAHNALQLWDFRNCQLEKTIHFPGSIIQGEYLYAAQFCNHHTVIAGGSGTCSAIAINVVTDEVLGEVSLTNKPVLTVDSIQEGQLIAVAGIGGNLHTATLC